jgi:hypothetical protein
VKRNVAENTHGDNCYSIKKGRVPCLFNAAITLIDDIRIPF